MTGLWLALAVMAAAAAFGLIWRASPLAEISYSTRDRRLGPELVHKVLVTGAAFSTAGPGSDLVVREQPGPDSPTPSTEPPRR